MEQDRRPERSCARCQAQMRHLRSVPKLGHGLGLGVDRLPTAFRVGPISGNPTTVRPTEVRVLANHQQLPPWGGIVPARHVGQSAIPDIDAVHYGKGSWPVTGASAPPRARGVPAILAVIR
jgi:hypothetical protein